MNLADLVHFCMVVAGATIASIATGDPMLPVYAVVAEAVVLGVAFARAWMQDSDDVAAPLFASAILAALFAPSASAQALLAAVALAEFCQEPVCESLGLFDEDEDDA